MRGINQRKSIFAIPAGSEIYWPNPNVRGARATESLPYLEKNFFILAIFSTLINFLEI